MDAWSCTELTTDLIFITEIFVAFNTTILVLRTNKYELSRSMIAKTYMKGWFLIDCVAVFPRFARLMETSGSAAALLGILKFARISRIIKLFRLLKYLKGGKEKN